MAKKTLLSVLMSVLYHRLTATMRTHRSILLAIIRCDDTKGKIDYTLDVCSTKVFQIFDQCIQFTYHVIILPSIITWYHNDCPYMRTMKLDQHSF